MKSILEFFALFSLERAFGLVRDLVKGHALSIYIKALDGARSVVFTIVLALAFLLIFFCGFLMLHFALFMGLPWATEHRVLLLAILGSIYLLGPIVGINLLLSKKRWLKICGASKTLDDLDNQSN